MKGRITHGHRIVVTEHQKPESNYIRSNKPVKLWNMYGKTRGETPQCKTV